MSGLVSKQVHPRARSIQITQGDNNNKLSLRYRGKNTIIDGMHSGTSSVGTNAHLYTFRNIKYDNFGSPRMNQVTSTNLDAIAGNKNDNSSNGMFITTQDNNTTDASCENTRAEQFGTMLQMYQLFMQIRKRNWITWCSINSFAIHSSINT